ncbi:MFS transporter [Prauserella aidingensis]|uniref:MFS transporter n=1 Tax=Prauserella aidingensis TaxID=387890 RepID=UPI0020A2E772|nr:MFS transporter [Prauserella aidingensis]
MIVSASVALAMTAPGQTAAISLFVDPLAASLHVSRSAVAMAYSIGSLAAALVIPLLGKLLDRFGARRAMLAVGVCFGVALLAAGTVTELAGLTAAFVGIRVGGQGALSLVATTAVTMYMLRHKGLATGIVSAIGTSAISLAPLALERLIGDLGWRTVWQLEGWAVLVIMVPVALLILPPHVHSGGETATNVKPAEPGSRYRPGGEAADRGHGPSADWTLRDASRTPVFWVVVSGAGVCSLITTALMFHQVSLLGNAAWARPKRPRTSSRNWSPGCSPVSSWAGRPTTSATVHSSSPSWRCSRSPHSPPGGCVRGGRPSLTAWRSAPAPVGCAR